MPALTIIDEQRCALEKIEALAQLGLADHEQAADALAAILITTVALHETISGILSA